MSDPKIEDPKLKDKKPLRLEIKIDDDVAAGSYANLCIVNHSDAEFVFDFVFVQPARRKSKVTNRIVMSPKNAKRLLMLLQQQLKTYEARFGKLDISTQPILENGEMELN